MREETRMATSEAARKLSNLLASIAIYDAAVTGHCSAKDVGFWLESMARHDRSFANVLKKVVEKI